jgi:selenide,water dikinase
MVPGFVADHYSLERTVPFIALEPLVRRAGVRWLQRSVRHLDAAHQAVLLDDGSRVQYDWLSINTGPVQNREQIERDIPGAREHGLFGAAGRGLHYAVAPSG